jgi:hypothetical protein
VHYLQNKHNAAFGRFQVELARLSDWRDAWRKHLPELTPERLDAGMVAYANGSQFATWEAPLQMPPFEAHVRRLSAAQAHGVQARTAWLMGNEALAEQERTAAQQLDPDEVRAARSSSPGCRTQRTRPRAASSHSASPKPIPGAPRRATAGAE